MKRSINEESSNKRYKFETLNKKFSSINIKAILNKHLHEIDYTDNDDPNPFNTRLAQLKDINLHAGFQSLAREISPFTNSLEQLIHYKSKILDSISHHLSLKYGDDPWRSWLGILDLIPALARSLSSLLHPHLPQLLPILCSLPTSDIAHNNPQLLEKSYVVLASLLSQLSRDLLKDNASSAIDIYNLLIPFITNTSEHAKWIAQAWSAFIRRSKGNALNALLTHMLQSTSSSPLLEESIAISISEAIKSPNLTLHSRTHVIFSFLVNYSIDNPQSNTSASITIRVLISAIHHIRDPAALKPMSDVVVSSLETQTQSKERNGSISIAMRFAQVLLGVRKATRVDDGSRRAIFKLLLSLISSKSLEGVIFIHYLQLLATALCAGKLEDLLSPGIQVLDKVFAHSDKWSVLGFCMALSELQWSGIEQFVLPPLSKTSFADHQYELFTLLATLAERSQLPIASTVAHQRFQSFFRSLNKELEKCVKESVDRIINGFSEDSDIDLLSNIAILVHANVGIEAKQYSDVIFRLFDHLTSNIEETVQDEFSKTPYNKVWLTSISISIISKLGKEDLVRERINSIVLRYSNYSIIVKALSQLCEQGNKPTLSSEAVDKLRVNILTYSTELRVSSLKLLSQLRGDFDSIYEKCYEVEGVPLTVQSSRDRNMTLRRVGQHLLAADATEESRKVGAMFMLSQFKVNFRPIYEQASDSLGELMGAHTKLLWPIFLPELEHAAGATQRSNTSTQAPSWMTSDDVFKISDQGVMISADYVTDDSTFRCTNLDKWVKGLQTAFNDLSKPVKRSVNAQKALDRFDINNYEELLLETLSKCSNVAEKNTKTLNVLFMKFTDRENADLDDDEEGIKERQSLKTLKGRLVSWLKLYATFNNPKAMYKSTEMWNLFLDFLSKGDNNIQLKSLECILTWKDVSINTYEETLKNLLNESNFRDELINFSLNIESQAISPGHREGLIPIVIRLLYGVMTWRKGRSSGNQGSSVRRIAVLTALSGCLPQELSTLIDLMTVSLKDARPTITQNSVQLKDLDTPPAGKRQIGYLSLLEDLLKYMGKSLVDYWPTLLGITVELIHDSQRRISSMKDSQMDVDGEPSQEDSQVAQHTPLRNVRILGLKRLGDFFRVPSVEFNFEPYLKSSFESFIAPRIDLLSIENTQAPSSLLELFAIWSDSPLYLPYLQKFDQRLLSKVFEIITANNVKPAVVLRVFDIVDNIIQVSEFEDTNDETDESIALRKLVREQILKPNVHSLLVSLSDRFDKFSVGLNKGNANAKDDIAKRQIGILSNISKYIDDQYQARRVLDLLQPLLRQSHKVVNEKIKTNLLSIYSNLLKLVPDFSDISSEFHIKNYNLFVSLFSLLRSRQARNGLIDIMEVFTSVDKSFKTTYGIISALNSWSTKRIGEPDFDKRLAAFGKVEDQAYDWKKRDWLAILHNMLFFIGDPEELSIRSSASSVMRKFVQVVSESQEDELEETLLRMLYPGLRRILKTKFELVRIEIISVIARAVEKCDNISTFTQMRPLLMDGDEEANFFNNVHHFQLHRRSRALQRLGDFASKGILPNDALVKVFIPIIGHFVSGATDKKDHNLTTDAIRTLGQCSSKLGWSAYNNLVRSYLKLAKAKDSNEKVYIRATMSILEHFHFNMSEDVEKETAEKSDDEGEEESDDEDLAIQQGASAAKVSEAVTNRLLPLLLKYLEQKDETEASIRIPIAAGYVRVALFLPAETRDMEVNRLITVLAQVFKSKDSDTRVLAREVLCKISTIVGPDYLPSIITALKEALTRGAQLHVLSYTVHSVILHLIESEAGKYDNLDLVSQDVIAIITETIFGRSAKDAQNEEWKTQTKEVKSAKNKSLDTYQILARLCSPSKMPVLLLPVRDMITVTESAKTILAVDEVLRRVSLGVISNKQFSPSDILSLCYSLIAQKSKFATPSEKKGRKKENVKEGAIVQLKRDVRQEKNYFENNSHKFINLGLDLFNTSFKRSQFDFKNTDHLARMDPLVSAIGNVLFSSNTDTVILGLRSTSNIARAPLPSIDKSLGVFVKRIFALLDDCGGTQSELAQTTLRALSVILREVKTATIKEEQLKHLLVLIKPDLEEHDRQHTLFTLLKSIINRKLIVPEIYEIMERVSEVMVTNQSSQVREICRNIYLQFLLDYPQGKARVKKVFEFLAKNLSYVYESGRLSVMELLSVIIQKFDPDNLRNNSDIVFLALVMVLANDDSATCKESASAIIKSILGVYDKSGRDKVAAMMHSWAHQVQQPSLQRLSAQVSGIFVDALDSTVGKAYLPDMLSDMMQLLKVDEWQVVYHSLNSLLKVITTYPETVGEIDWVSIVEILNYQHVWVRYQTSKLINSLFTIKKPFTPKLGKDGILSLESMVELARKFSFELRSKHLDNDIAHQVVKNLIFISRCFATVPIEIKNEKKEEDDEEIAEKAAEEEEGDEEEVSAEESWKRDPLGWLFRKLSYQSRLSFFKRSFEDNMQEKKLWIMQPTFICHWMGYMVNTLDSDRITMYIYQLLHPLVRITGDENIKKDNELDELQNLAQEVMSMIQSKVDNTLYLRVYQAIKQRVVAVRDERKFARKQNVIKNPQLAAHQKSKRSAAKVDSKKRKNKHFASQKRTVT
ncbi:hypothetical protein E3Q12_00708 [Wallemia mellicola]|uniref:ARM repeat-containing protein n=1 Tax=Wallemia mellicola TaxID=1708541 RepID=A0AB74KL21_9BASI|nr:hypothetical protein E3Q12_00708 [Wallemia mellicola]TIC71065.1 hypothetical protein E3Q03_00654 [Wallemia mellicola]